MGDLLWTLFKYALVILVILFLVWLVVRLLTIDKFVPTGPSQTGDKKETTPAGNVILY
jgi:flagellar biogenesis protein FliO